MSMVCGTNKIAWAHVDRGMTVLDWQEMECPTFLRGTYMASSYLDDVSTFVRFNIIEMKSIKLFHAHVAKPASLILCGHHFIYCITVCQQVSAVVAVLPSADFYIIEKSSISVQNTSLFPIMAHMRTVEAMLFALLEPRTSSRECNVPPRCRNHLQNN